MAPYILLENPNKPPLECIRESKKLMAGNKWRLFCVDISFIGWFLGAILPFLLVSEDRFYILIGEFDSTTIPDLRYFIDISSVGFIFDFIVIFFVGFLLISILYLYFKTAEAEFYIEVTKDLEDPSEIIRKAEAYDRIMAEKETKEAYKPADTKLMPDKGISYKATNTSLMPEDDN